MPELTMTAHDGGSFTGYLSGPASGGVPGIVLIQEIFGVNQVMRDLADRLAGEGYIVLCPDLFWRQEPGIQITDKTEQEWAKAFELYKGFDVGNGVEDLKTALATLRGMKAVAGKVGTVGFCLGGKLAYLMSTRSDADCNVSYYGVGIEADLAEASRISKPTLLHIAEKDQFVPPEAQAAIKQGLAGHPQVTIHAYPGCDHAFARRDGAHFDAEAAKLADDRTLAFFARHLA